MSLNRDRFLLVLSICIQIALGLFFGHAYDTRIFMASGYLVGTGQNPYIAQNLGVVFNNITFQGITSFGYPPPWELILGLIYLGTYRIIPNFLLYNLAIKLPIIAVNICLAFLVAHVLDKSGAQKKISRRAWIFLLFNPFLLITSSAWGQFDSVVALLSLFSLYLLSEGKLTGPAILLAMAISFKPIAIPIVLVVLIFLAQRSVKHTLKYFGIFFASVIIFCVIPFIIFRWDPAPILKHWNAHFSVGGGMTFMTFLESLKNSYKLPGLLRILGWIWVPALGIAAYILRDSIHDFKDLLRASVALIMMFFLFRTWLSEPNVILVLPMVLILTCLNDLEPSFLGAVWVLPLIFGFFNTSLAQLLFPSMPGVMDELLKLAVQFNPVRFTLRTIVVIAWLATGWWIVFICYKMLRNKAKEMIPD